jgi:chromosome segregation ATPase
MARKPVKIGVRPNKAEIDVNADIEKLQELIRACRDNIQTLHESINTLRQKQTHYRNLIAEDNKFSKKQLQQNIDATEVDIRATMDAIATDERVIVFNENIVNELRQRQKDGVDGFSV